MGHSRGIHCHPISLVICAEGLSTLLQEVEATEKISGVKICYGAPVLSHLLFADDSVLLLKTRQEEAQALRQILDLYEDCSSHLLT